MAGGDKNRIIFESTDKSFTITKQDLEEMGIPEKYPGHISESIEQIMEDLEDVLSQPLPTLDIPRRVKAKNKGGVPGNNADIDQAKGSGQGNKVGINPAKITVKRSIAKINQDEGSKNKASVIYKGKGGKEEKPGDVNQDITSSTSTVGGEKQNLRQTNFKPKTTIPIPGYRSKLRKSRH